MSLLRPLLGVSLMVFGQASCGGSPEPTVAAVGTNTGMPSTGGSSDDSDSDSDSDSDTGNEQPVQRAIAVFWGSTNHGDIDTVWSLSVEPIEVVPLGQQRNLRDTASPVLSPDKTMVAFVDGDDTQNFVMVAPSDGSEAAIDITPPHHAGNWGVDYPFIATLEWTYDGAEVLVMWDGVDYGHTPNPTGSFWRVDVVSGVAELIASDVIGSYGFPKGPLVRNHRGRATTDTTYGYFLEYYDLDTRESRGVGDWSVASSGSSGSASLMRNIVNAHGSAGDRVLDLLPAGATQPFSFQVEFSPTILHSGTWSPKGDRLLTYLAPGRCHVLDTAGEIEFEAAGNYFSWSTDGKYLTGVAPSGVVFIADTETWSVTSLGIRADRGLTVDWGSEGVLFSNRNGPADELHYLGPDGLELVLAGGLQDADIDHDGLGFVYGTGFFPGPNRIGSVRAGESTVLWTDVPPTRTVHASLRGTSGYALVRSIGEQGDELTLIDRTTAERTSISADLGVRIRGLLPLD